MKYFTTPFAILLFIFCVVLNACNTNHAGDGVNLDVNAKPLEKLSEYRFYKDAGRVMLNKGVIPYLMVNSMFNDYALKENFIYLPEGQTFSFDSLNLINLPVGGCLIKEIYYLKDNRNEAAGKNLVETQLLIRKPSGWEARSYHWTDDQKDAVLTENGGSKSFAYIDKNGVVHQANYVMPGKAECNSCHLRTNQLLPIGAKAGNLNPVRGSCKDSKPQLGLWKDLGILKNSESEKTEPFANFNDTGQALDKRARAYLDINCAHCHNPQGPAFVSGLFLNADNTNTSTYGICKPPLSKGHGTCNLNYDILPGNPAQSIVVCRLASTEFGVKMPERGRTLVDTAGVALISQWIAQMQGGCK